MDKEIQEMFKKKNKEIIKNNLKEDIDTNIKSMTDTFANILNNNFDTSIKNINSVYEDSLYYESNTDVTKIMSVAKLNFYNLINKEIENRKEKLANNLLEIEFTEEDIDNYYVLVDDTSIKIKDIFKNEEYLKIKDDIVDKLNKITNKNLNNNVEIVNNRINDYVNIRLFGKIEDKFFEELKLRDTNLKNKGKESYEKFKDITNKTVNI